MKTRFHVKLLSTALLSLWLTSGCADQSTKSEAAASKASPEATAAITNASDAIAIALRTQSPIYVHQTVIAESNKMDREAIGNSTEPSEQTGWEDVLENMSPEDFKYKM